MSCRPPPSGRLSTCSWPHDVAGRRTEPARDLEQPDSEVGAGTPETECPECPLLQHRSALVQRRDVAPPRVDGVRFVEARDRRDLRPEPLRVGLAEQASRPSLGRTCDHGPGGRQTGRQVAHDLPRAPRLGPCGSRRIDVREQLRIGVAERDDERGALGIEGGGLQPGWGAIQQLVGGVERVQAPDVVVDVEAHDVSGAGAPPRFGHSAKQRRVLRLAVDDQLLAFLEVDADTHRELGVARGVIHRATISPASRAVNRRRPARRRARASRRPARSRCACRWRSRSGSRDPCRGSRTAGRDRAGAATPRP